MGIVGAGFVGPHHIDAVRRLGYVDVVAVAGSSQASAEKKAEALGARKAYGSYEALLDDPDVQVVHNATPNYLHYPVNAAAIAKGKHVISDKPLAMTAAEAKKLLDQATKAGIVHAVTFNYRGNPLVQQARHAIKRGDIGKPHFLVGHYLQDWLLKDTDYSWRLEPDKGGASSALGDIGSHWCDLAQHVSGLRITHVLGDITTVLPTRKKPRGSREAFAAATRTRDSRTSTSRSRISPPCCCGSTTARKGQLLGRAGLRRAQERSASSRSAGRRRRSAGGRNSRTSSGSATATRPTRSCRRIPSLLDRRGARATRTCRAGTRNRGPTRLRT